MMILRELLPYCMMSCFAGTRMILIREVGESLKYHSDVFSFSLNASYPKGIIIIIIIIVTASRRQTWGARPRRERDRACTVSQALRSYEHRSVRSIIASCTYDTVQYIHPHLRVQ
jgi:hypothetical protein